jgi:hypothetical protein
MRRVLKERAGSRPTKITLGREQRAGHYPEPTEDAGTLCPGQVGTRCYRDHGDASTTAPPSECPNRWTRPRTRWAASRTSAVMSDHSKLAPGHNGESPLAREDLVWRSCLSSPHWPSTNRAEARTRLPGQSLLPASLLSARGPDSRDLTQKSDGRCTRAQLMIRARRDSRIRAF